MMNNILHNNLLLNRHRLYENIPAQPRRRPRTYRLRENPLLQNFTDEEIRARFRFRRDSIQSIHS